MGKREGSPVRGREGWKVEGSEELLLTLSLGCGVLLSDVEVEGVLVVFGFLVR